LKNTIRLPTRRHLYAKSGEWVNMLLPGITPRRLMQAYPLDIIKNIPGCFFLSLNLFIGRIFLLSFNLPIDATGKRRMTDKG